MQRPSSSAFARQRIRSLNQSAVINAIHRNGRISRTDLAAELRLSPAAITALTAPLIEGGLVMEAAVGISASVGRKPILLGINYDHAMVLGVKVMNQGIIAALTNLNAEVQAVHNEPIADTGVATVIKAIKRATEVLAPETGAAGANLIGMGVNLPGIVDHQAGSVRHSPLLGWYQVPFAAALRDEIGLPALIENDVNALAAAHAWFGHGRGHEAFLVVTLGRGVGLGIVIGGALHRGPRGGAGEVGHTLCTPLGARVMSGETTTLEERLGDAGLIAQARRLLPGLPEDLDADGLSAMAAAGTEVVLDLLHDAGSCLGSAIGDLVNVFAPSLVILGGEGLRNAAYLLPALRKALEKRTFGDLGEGLELIVDTWGDDAWARGAAGVAAARFLEEASTPLSITRATRGSA